VVPLPSLGLYTRRATEQPAPLVQAFAQAIRSVSVRPRTRGEGGKRPVD